MRSSKNVTQTFKTWEVRNVFDDSEAYVGNQENERALKRLPSYSCRAQSACHCVSHECIPPSGPASIKNVSYVPVPKEGSMKQLTRFCERSEAF